MLGLGFNSLRFARIVAAVTPSNERGLKLLRRLGFRVESEQPDPASRTGTAGVIGFLDAPTR